MTPQENAARLGRILLSVGYVWGLLYIVSNFFNFRIDALDSVLDFFGSSFFIPIALIFGGRAVSRRARVRGRGDEETQEEEARRRMERPVPRTVTPPPRKPAPAPAPRETAPSPAPREATPMDFEPGAADPDELAAVLGLDEETLSSDLQSRTGTDRRPTHKPLTSEERIAAARKRFIKDD